MELKCLQTKKYNYKAGKIKPNTVFKADNADKLRCGLKQCYVDCPVGNGVLNMELIKKSEIKVLSTPGVKSFQLLNPENSKSERITITKVFVQPNNEQPRHKHDTSEQIWIAVSGKGVLLLADGKTRRCCTICRRGYSWIEKRKPGCIRVYFCDISSNEFWICL